MKRIKHQIVIVAVLLAALTLSACVHPLEHDNAELMVSVYIPDVVATKAETGPVNPTENERKITKLQIWVFLHDEAGSQADILVTYKLFDVRDKDTGLRHEAVTRFGLPLSTEMFKILSAENAKVDVYAVANADPIWGLDVGTTRDELEAFVLKEGMYGVNPLTTTVPEAGLPMSGVLKNADVKGGYPVLNVSKPNISSLTLVRAVSKIRFVFVQQGKDSNPTENPLNTYCAIKRIEFTGGGIAKEERLFTENASAISEDYTSLSGIYFSGDPLLANGQIACAETPEDLVYRAGETAQAYETRLDAALGTKVSQVGPVYFRETDQTITGRITFVTDNSGTENTVDFNMAAGDALLRNHSWIVYAYFSEETRTLELTVTVLPWQKDTFQYDYTDASVNVVRRFAVTETNPATFTKIQMPGDFFDVLFWHTVTINEQERENEIKADIIIATPVGGILHAVPVPGALDGVTVITDAIKVEPLTHSIYPNGIDNGTNEDCKIEFTITCNKGTHSDAELEGQYIDLHFYVEHAGREIDLGSESRDYFRFRLKQNWKEQ